MSSPWIGSGHQDLDIPEHLLHTHKLNQPDYLRSSQYLVDDHVEKRVLVSIKYLNIIGNVIYICVLDILSLILLLPYGVVYCFD